MRKQADPIVTSKLVERFWSKVDVREPNECWPWTARKMVSGYGQIWVSEKHRAFGAHRLSLLIAGHPSNGGVAMHECDNPSCVNPAHLSWGTYSQNALDKFRRGRGADRRGVKHPLAALAETDVIAIRASSGPRKELARRFNTSPDNITQIRAGRRWKHVAHTQSESHS